MTFDQFKNLNEADQEMILWIRGVCVGERTDLFYKYALFQVDAFYLEVQYMPRYKTIKSISCFEDTVLLDPYLEKIQIDITC